MRLAADLSILGLLVAALVAVWTRDHVEDDRGLGIPDRHESALVTAPGADASSDATGPVADGKEAIANRGEERDAEHVADDPPHADPDPPPAPKKSAGMIAVAFEPFDVQLLENATPPPVELPKTPEPLQPQITGEPPVDTPVPKVPEPQKVEFFDSETKAVSVGFVVDCSSSMAGSKFQAVCAELAKSISNLSPGQSFHVVFFNDAFFPMSGGSATPRLVPASLQNKQDILRFLQTAQASGGTNPEPALQFVSRLRPDVVYLLTDGEFHPLQPQTYNGFRQARIKVHTIGFEAGQPIPILQEIAALTGGSYRTAVASGNASPFFTADPQIVEQALKNADVQVRSDAVSAVVLRQLPLVNELIGMLSDADQGVRQAVHDGLRQMGGGIDFGPTSAGDLDDAKRRWKFWWSHRRASRTTLLNAIGGDDMNKRWVAAVLARQSSLNAPDELIAAMRSSPEPICQELHAALVACGGGQDFGPIAGATQEAVAEAADRWQQHFREQKEKAERAELAKRQRIAAEKLRLTKQLIDINPDAVERRCRELLREYPETTAASEAKQLLEDMASEDEEAEK
jgi:hypothetical protein